VSADRRFTSWLLIAFGPLFVLGGFAAAFTIEGALFVFLGLAMLTTGILLRTRLPLIPVIVAGFIVFAALTAQMAVELA
jgi:hypothetical protein